MALNLLWGGSLGIKNKGPAGVFHAHAEIPSSDIHVSR